MQRALGAIILTLVALQIGYESAVRLVRPVPIAYTEAIARVASAEYEILGRRYVKSNRSF